MRTVGSLNPWMASTLIIRKSIAVAITRLPKKNDPPAATTSGVTWKSMGRSAQIVGTPCLVRQYNRLMSSSMSLKNICPNASRCRLWLLRSWKRSCSRGKKSTFATTSGCKFHKALWRHTQRSGSTCFDSSMLCELRPNCPQASTDRLQLLAAPSVCKDPYADPGQTRGRCCPHNVCIVGRRGSALRSSPNDNELGCNSTHPSSETDEVSLQTPTPRLDEVREQARNGESRQECLQGGFADPWP